jgi:Zn-dependent alcohol dehydrogenase
MRSAVVRQFGGPLVIEARPIPEPAPGQVVVRMETSGLCHTDIHAAKDLGADLVIDARTDDPAGILHAHGGATVAVGLAVDDESFATVNEAIGEVLHGQAKARIVLLP